MMLHYLFCLLLAVPAIALTLNVQQGAINPFDGHRIIASKVDTLRVYVDYGFVAGQDSLACPADTKSKFRCLWNSQTGILQISGKATVLEFQDLLQKIEYSNFRAILTESVKTLSWAVADSGRIVFYSSQSNRAYELVLNRGIPFQSALAHSSNSTWGSVNGFLATITSQKEDAFVASFFKGWGYVWLGATDEVNEGVWKWTSGPVNGTAFWQGSFDGSSVDGSFNNWGASQPNNNPIYDSCCNGEDYLAYNLYDGHWYDLPDSDTNARIAGFLVKFPRATGMGGSEIVSVYSTPSCTPKLNCNNNGVCSKLGKCDCRAGFAGDKCEKCSLGHERFPSCSFVPSYTQPLRTLLLNITGKKTIFSASVALSDYTLGDVLTLGSSTISSVFNTKTGVLSLVDAASTTSYQSALQSVWMSSKSTQKTFKLTVSVDKEKLTTVISNWEIPCSSNGFVQTGGGCSCKHGFKGANCEECDAGFFGKTCKQCDTCYNGECSDGINGTGNCKCKAGFDKHINCFDCLSDGGSDFYGTSCTSKCPPCVHGHCNQGVKGDGKCVCESQFNPASACTQCNKGFWGPKCDMACQCNEKGTCSDGIAGSGECKCDGNFDPDTRCKKCKIGFEGSDCSTATSCDVAKDCNANGVCEGKGCSCKAAWAGDAKCSKCASGYAGTLCEPVCEFGCGNGACTAPNVCSCNQGWERNAVGQCVKPEIICGCWGNTKCMDLRFKKFNYRGRGDYVFASIDGVTVTTKHTPCGHENATTCISGVILGMDDGNTVSFDLGSQPTFNCKKTISLPSMLDNAMTVEQQKSVFRVTIRSIILTIIPHPTHFDIALNAKKLTDVQGGLCTGLSQDGRVDGSVNPITFGLSWNVPVSKSPVCSSQKLYSSNTLQAANIHGPANASQYQTMTLKDPKKALTEQMARVDCCTTYLNCPILFKDCISTQRAFVGLDSTQCSSMEDISDIVGCNCAGHAGGADCKSCKPNWFGPNCQKFCSSEVGCSKHGLCDGNGNCVCSKGWRGSDCSLRQNVNSVQVVTSACQDDVTCNARGSCVKGKCECALGWAGTNCTECNLGYERMGHICKPVCYPQCSNKATCVAPGKCSCPTGFTGATCSQRQMTCDCWGSAHCKTFSDKMFSFGQNGHFLFASLPEGAKFEVKIDKCANSKMNVMCVERLSISMPSGGTVEFAVNSKKPIIGCDPKKQISPPAFFDGVLIRNLTGTVYSVQMGSSLLEVDVGRHDGLAFHLQTSALLDGGFCSGLSSSVGTLQDQPKISSSQNLGQQWKLKDALVSACKTDMACVSKAGKKGFCMASAQCSGTVGASDCKSGVCCEGATSQNDQASSISCSATKLAAAEKCCTEAGFKPCPERFHYCLLDRCSKETTDTDSCKIGSTHLTSIRGQCCSGNFAGETCKSCQKNFYGATCNQFCDPESTCNGHGQCEQGSGECICAFEYSRSSDCSLFGEGLFAGQMIGGYTAVCEPSTSCSGHGFCDSKNACGCDSAWSGDPKCSSCADGFKGVRCEPICEGGCSKGRCARPGKCSCEESWTGKSCDKPMRSATLSGDFRAETFSGVNFQYSSMGDSLLVKKNSFNVVARNGLCKNGNSTCVLSVVVSLDLTSSSVLTIQFNAGETKKMLVDCKKKFLPYIANGLTLETFRPDSALQGTSYFRVSFSCLKVLVAVSQDLVDTQVVSYCPIAPKKGLLSGMEKGFSNIATNLTSMAGSWKLNCSESKPLFCNRDCPKSTSGRMFQSVSTSDATKAIKCCSVFLNQMNCGQMLDACLADVMQQGRCPAYDWMEQNADSITNCLCASKGLGEHLKGSLCDECMPNYFGSGCARFCHSTQTCSGRGTCDGNGNCVCSTGWKNSDCSVVDNPEASKPIADDQELGCFNCDPDGNTTAVPCKLDAWSPWGKCSNECGGGIAFRSRSVVVSPVGAGMSCDQTMQGKACNTEPCSSDCVVSTWGEWEECSAVCGGGGATRERKVLKKAVGSGKGCSILMEEGPCNIQPCTNDCIQTQWSDWSDCSKSCGGGTRSRSRSTSRNPIGSGKACGITEEVKGCNTEKCGVNCVWGAWMKWSDCDQLCTKNNIFGTHSRTRTVVTVASKGGNPCQGPSKELRTCNTAACVTDCKLSDWGDWSDCSASCGGGQRKRTRTVNTKATEGGKPCSTQTMESRACNTDACSQDCVTSEWGEWGECTLSCGSGSSSRTRTVLKKESDGGAPCPKLKEVVEGCNAYPCASDCQVSEWGAWDDCPVDCGESVHSRSRKLLKESLGSGKLCGEITESRSCKKDPCPVDCIMDAWSDWSSCSAECGKGSISRSRPIVRKASYGGKACGVTVENKPCDQPCPVNCVLRNWVVYTRCTVSCGGGSLIRKRDVLTQPENGGKPCPVRLQEVTCNEQPCACEMSRWSSWTSCSKECGAGKHTRTRKVLFQPKGATCPELEESAFCNIQDCPVDCVWSSFSSYSGCSATCGSGRQTRQRSIKTQAAYGGSKCVGNEKEVRFCNTPPCPVDCEVSYWGDWDTCTLECGKGKKSRRREIIVQSANAGTSCPRLEQSRWCNSIPCPVHCEVGRWSDWSKCDAKCGGGKVTRTRSITTSPSNGGDSCLVLSEQKPCNIHPCAVDCVVGKWADWSECSVTCGGSIQTRKRAIVVSPKNNGKSCNSLIESQPCNEKACPFDCEVSSWSFWDTCSEACGNGTRSRSRLVVTKAADGGKVCPTVLEREACKNKECPIDCVVSFWGKFSNCGRECNGGKKNRTRTILTAPQYGGEPCPRLTQSLMCNTSPCPVDCVLGRWKQQCQCDVECGGGLQFYRRPVLIASEFGGKSCSSLRRQRNCNTDPCAVDCSVSEWGIWSSCTSPCGNGTTSRSRKIQRASDNGGKECPVLNQVAECNTHACPVKCEVGSWSSWRKCSVKCGGGKKARARSVTTQPANGGDSCPPLVDVGECNLDRCFCNMSAWSKWSDCSQPCAGGERSRNRTIVDQPYLTTKCPELQERQPCNTLNCPVDCVTSKWSEWSNCTRSCGKGVRSRSRSIQVQAAFGGETCPEALAEEEQCNSNPCPVDCELSTWSGWDDCSKDCGSGIRVRTRTVQTPPLYGGDKCMGLKESKSCNTQPCPVDCEVGDWEEWDPCSVSCGRGERSRVRSITTQPANKGELCPILKETGSCNHQLCPVDCTISLWSEFSSCSRTCGGGYKNKTRTITTLPLREGKACPTLQLSEPCSSDPCPVDCIVGEWGDWSGCSSKCDGGMKRKTRSIVTESANGGRKCPATQFAQPCNSQPCDVDCVVSDWSDWTECTNTCGGGKQSRKRAVVVKPIGAGEECGPLTSARRCNIDPCPIDCEVDDWKVWGSCTVSCGNGMRKRTRQFLRVAQYGGKCDLSSVELETCNTFPCPIDCVVSPWSMWAVCSTTCGTGTTRRTRVVTTKPLYSGKVCPVLQADKDCNTQPCPIDSVVVPWDPWTICTKTCGGGTTGRKRTVKVFPKYGGRPIPVLNETKDCNTQPCPIDCVVYNWQSWSSCTTSCGTGSKKRFREVVEPKYGGQACPKEVNQTSTCNTDPCPIDCVVSAWKSWENCSVECNGGRARRTRDTLVEPKYGGSPCPRPAQFKRCNLQQCECTMSDWGAWGKCDRTCGNGNRTRARTVVYQPRLGSTKKLTPCPTTSEIGACNTEPCPIDCVVSAWSSWSECTKTCGTGQQGHARTITIEAAFGGKVCPTLKGIRECSTNFCPIFCQVADWNDWSVCDKSCGGGLQNRSRAIAVEPKYTDAPCPDLEEARSCNRRPCPVDCTVSNWSPWSDCTLSCGSGQQTGTRSITQQPLYGGKGCPALERVASCNKQPCPINCVVSDWSPWSTCSKTCAAGEQKRTRTILTDVKFGGTPCPELIDTLECNTQKCPIDCIVSSWSDWSTCTQSCGIGAQLHTRIIQRESAYGGKACPVTTVTQKCNTQHCPIDCSEGGFSKWSKCTKSCGEGTTNRKRSYTGLVTKGSTITLLNVAFKLFVSINADGVLVPSLKADAFQVVDMDFGKIALYNVGQSRFITFGEAGFATAKAKINAIPEDAAKFTPWVFPQNPHIVALYSSVMTAFLRMNTKTANGFEGITTGSPKNAWNDKEAFIVKDVNGNDISINALTPSYGGEKCPMTSSTVACNTNPCPINCVVSDWGTWDACTKVCGVGSQTRSRIIATAVKYGGLPCPNTDESQKCNTQPCPIHCIVSDWSSWGTCDKTCGVGSHSRTRKVVVAAKYGGRSCSSLVATKKCNTDFCPIDCVVGSWASWDTCSAVCGSGTQSRMRGITTSPLYGGKSCPTLSQSGICNTDPCPIHCVVSYWGKMSSCSKTCGGGVRSRARTILTEPKYGGATCPRTEMRRRCNSDACPIDCEVSGWNNWGQCSEPCGNGTQTRGRTIVVSAKYGGVPCPVLESIQVCPENPPCPIPCELSKWGEWKSCTKSCGGGSKTRTRTVTVEPKFGAKSCEALSNTESCNSQECPIDCTVGSWKDWSKCSLECGSGSKLRERPVTQRSLYGGKACPAVRETAPCNTQKCVCTIGPWTTWTTCPVTCGGSTQYRTRKVLKTYTGVVCNETADEQVCNDKPCPVDCEHTWGQYSSCSVSCGGGKQERAMVITTAVAYGGKDCPADRTQSKVCNTVLCAVDCVVSYWGEFSDCSKTCGKGASRSRDRKVLVEEKNNGVPCPRLRQTQSCRWLPTCPVDCVIGKWSEWSDCSKECETGDRSRSRAVAVYPAFEGKSCIGALNETEKCNTQICLRNCEPGSWSDWSKCTNTCGGGTQTRARPIAQQATGGGKECPEESLKNTQACNEDACPIDCIWKWQDWGDCSKSCGSGAHTRGVIITRPAAYSGVACPKEDKMEEKLCNTQCCPSDCKWTGWSTWATCSKNCGGGVQERTRTISKEKECGGKCVGTSSTSQECNTHLCPVACVWIWSKWESCSKTCNTGTQSRTVVVKAQPIAGGKECPLDPETQKCGTSPCPAEDCIPDEWRQWSQCTKTCGGGNQTRSRSIKSPALYGGASCSLNESQSCNDQPCPIPCEWKWSPFGVCDKTCGGGSRQRRVIVTRAAAFKGTACPTTTVSFRRCNTDDCPPPPCIMSSFGDWSLCSKTCGTGKQTRSRVIVRNGPGCNATEESRTCSPDECPPPCVIGSWSSYSACSATCAGGKKYRTRSLSGYCEETTREEVECASNPCPIDCVMNFWSAMSACDVECGSGKRTRTRSVMVEPKYNGAACPLTRQSRSCRKAPCPIDCKIGSWGLWSACSAECGGGLQLRYRYNVQPMYGGKSCPESAEEQSCNIKRCPIVCELTDWSVWSTCSSTCGGGTTKRTRKVMPGKKCDGYELQQVEACNTFGCPIHCNVSSWIWEDCSVDCGGGTQTGRREILTQAANDGRACPGPNQLIDERRCGVQCCVQDCVVDYWSKFSECTATCGEAGTKTRTRKVLKASACEGKLCPVLNQTAPCNQVCCPSDCEVSTFSPWSDCTKQCGTGSQTRLRTIKKMASCSGQVCPALSENRKCNEQCCAVDCVVSPWGRISQCTKTCGGGVRSRTRTVLTNSACDGASCPLLKQSRRCGTECCPVDCGVSDWAKWSNCSATCAGGLQSRTRSVVNKTVCGGLSCPKMTEDRSCNTQCCSKDCQLGEWGSWATCSRQCGGGSRTRTRQVGLPVCGGTKCPADGLEGTTQTETESCNSQCCPRNCMGTRWTRWSRCDKTCGGGTRVRTRDVYREAQCGGRDCGVLNQTRGCATEECPVDCEMGQWQKWSSCDPGCGANRVTKRTRTISVEAANGGNECENVDSLGIETEFRSCSPSCCPEDCKTSEYGPWSVCDKQCGVGSMNRTRTVTQAKCQGKACASDLSLVETKSCNTHCCTVDCSLGDWSTWGDCSVTCDLSGKGVGGTKQRSRKVLKKEQCGGKCDETEETKQCNTQCCPTNCEVSDWNDWNDCTKSCGTGSHSRSRYVIKEANTACGGSCDFDLSETETCNTIQCPCRARNCFWRRWSRWGSCSKTCGGGIRRRSRQPYRQASCGGKECNQYPSTEERKCNTDPCPSKCECSECQNNGVCKDGVCQCHYMWGGKCCESPSQYCSVYGDPHALMFDESEETFGLSNTRFLIDVNYGIFIEGWSDIVQCDAYEMDLSGCVGNVNAVTVLEPTGDKFQVLMGEVDGYMDMKMMYGKECKLNPLRWGLGCDPEWCSSPAMDTGLGTAVTGPEDDHSYGLTLTYHFKGGANMQIQIFVLTDLTLQVDIYHGGASDGKQGVCWTKMKTGKDKKNKDTKDSIMCLPTPNKALALLPGNTAQSAGSPKVSSKWRPLDDLEISRGLHGRGNGQLRTHRDYVKCNTSPNDSIPCQSGIQHIASAVHVPFNQRVTFRHTHTSPLKVEVDGTVVLEKKDEGPRMTSAQFRLEKGWHQLMMAAEDADAVHFQWHLDGSGLHFAHEIPEGKTLPIFSVAQSKFAAQAGNGNGNAPNVTLNECQGIGTTMSMACCAALKDCSPSDYSNCVYDTCAHIMYMENNDQTPTCLYKKDRITLKVPACRCGGRFMRGDNCDQCLAGWYGDNCTTSCSVEGCNNRGTCNGDGSCDCKNGWGGDKCELDASGTSQTNCPNDCSGHGTCQVNVCVCDTQWNGDNACSTCSSSFSGENCEPVCTNPCVNGVCSQPNQCTCNTGFTGAVCDEIEDKCSFIGSGSLRTWDVQTQTVSGQGSDVVFATIGEGSSQSTVLLRTDKCSGGSGICVLEAVVVDGSAKGFSVRSDGVRNVNDGCSDVDITTKPCVGGVCVEGQNGNWKLLFASGAVLEISKPDSSPMSVWLTIAYSTDRQLQLSGLCTGMKNPDKNGNLLKSWSSTLSLFCPRDRTSRVSKAMVLATQTATLAVPGCSNDDLVKKAQTCCSNVKSCPLLYSRCLRDTCAEGRCIDYSSIAAKDSDCQCAGQFTGPNCLQCKAGWYGVNCNTYCTADTTCNGKGKCDANGRCTCDLMWRGSSDCSMLSFGGEPGLLFGGKQLVQTGSASCNAAVKCNGNGLCLSDGSCMCSLKKTLNGCVRMYYGADCKYYRQFCTQGSCSITPNAPKCVNSTQCNGHGTCTNGACVCGTATQDSCTYKYCGSYCQKWRSVCFTEQLSGGWATSSAPNSKSSGVPVSMLAQIGTSASSMTTSTTQQQASGMILPTGNIVIQSPYSGAASSTTSHSSNTPIVVLSCLLAVSTIGMMILGFVLWRSQKTDHPGFLDYQQWQDERAESNL